MTAVLAITRVTARNVLALRRLIGFGLLALVPGLIFVLSSRQATDFGRTENITGASVLFFSVVVPIVSIVVAGSVLGRERRSNTLSFLMLRPISRYAIAVSKLLSAIFGAFMISAIGGVGLGLSAAIMIGDWSYLIAIVSGTLISVAGYSAVFMPLGYLTERATLIGFVYIFIWEAAVAGIILGLSGTSLWRISYSGFAGLAPDGLDPEIADAALGSLSPGLGGAFVKVAVICVLAVGLTGWLLRTRDLT